MRGATPSVLPPLYCSSCGRKVAEIDIAQGSIRVTCGRCGTINSLTVKVAVAPAPSPPPLYVSEHEGESKPTRKKSTVQATT
jgi:phage FluMu protein Com